MSTQQLVMKIEAVRPREISVWQEINLRAVRDGHRVWKPRRAAREVMLILADRDWHEFMELSRALNHHAWCVRETLSYLKRRGIVHERPHFIGAPGMFPTVRPKEYLGYMPAYALTSVGKGLP